MTTYADKSNGPGSIVRHVATLPCDTIGTDIEWEQPRDMWLGVRRWNIGFDFIDPSNGRRYWGIVYADSRDIELRTRVGQLYGSRELTARQKIVWRAALAATGKRLIREARQARLDAIGATRTETPAARPVPPETNYQILTRATRPADEYTPVKWSFYAHGARYTLTEAQTVVRSINDKSDGRVAQYIQIEPE